MDTQHYVPFYSCKIVNDYSGSVVNPHFGIYGAVVFEGGGHAGTNDNSVIQLELGVNTCAFRRVTDPTPLAPGNDTTADISLATYDWHEMVLDGQPVSRHSYGSQDVVGPTEGGANFGTFYRVIVDSGTVAGHNSGEAPHKIDFKALSGNMNYERAGAHRYTGNSTSGFSGAIAAPPNWTAHVASQKRIYIEAHGATASYFVRWFDLVTGMYVNGTGTKRTANGSNDGGVMFHVPSRGLVLMLDTSGGNLRIRTLDVRYANPSWVNQARTLSTNISVASSWSAACWCADNERIIVGDVNGDPNCIYEIAIPTDLSANWAATHVPFLSGETIRWSPSACYKKWSYNPMVKAIVYLPYAATDGDETVYVYRPRGT